MKLTRALLGSFAALALTAALVPILASAQSVNCTPNNTWWNFWSGAQTNNCVQGSLLVYVQVLGNAPVGPQLQPSDFTVNVSGQDVSRASFPGSLSGVPVWVTGAYTVTAQPKDNYNVSYSQGCTGSVLNNAQATCVITESAMAPYYPYPTPYPYPYQPVPFTCSASQPTVALGQTVTFTTQGGTTGPYNWQLPGHSYPSAGSSIAIMMDQTGTLVATVTNGGKVASCTITVVASGYYPAPANPISPIPGAPGVVVTPTYVPALPNTGFEPLSPAGVAYAIAALLAAALVSLPYVRKAFAALLG